MQNKVHEFWESQAKKGVESGTRDLILDSLERNALSSYIKNGVSILEVGCGDGRLSIDLRKNYDINITAFDYSKNMIDLAVSNAEKTSITDINFFVQNLLTIDEIDQKFDIVISKRALINLSSYEDQVSVIKKVSKLLLPGGLFLMCESSKKGLKAINQSRQAFNLSEISSPWHNNYIDDDRLLEESLPLKLVKREDFSSTYYFLSRIVNAHLVDLEGKEPAYDSPVNEMALKLPSFGNMGQTILWVWKKG
ncbi:MAG: class I SAM-dependent methyltransferase [Desulfobacterales bacterium]|nr:class I SAM-dependent methyltransferase [Desulfobacterales bacterium]